MMRLLILLETTIVFTTMIVVTTMPRHSEKIKDKYGSLRINIQNTNKDYI